MMVFDAVDFDGDGGFFSERGEVDFVIDEQVELMAEVERSDEEVLEKGGGVGVFEVVEDQFGFVSKADVGGKESVVAVRGGGFFVEVAGGEEGIAFDGVIFEAKDEA